MTLDNCTAMLGSLPEPDMSHRKAVDDCEDETSYSAEAMEAERQRCYALGVAAGRERMLAGYREIAAASDLQMRDGDFARDIAERML